MFPVIIIFGTAVVALITCGYCYYMAVKISEVLDERHERRESWRLLANQLYHLLLVASIVSAWLGIQLIISVFVDIVQIYQPLWFAYNLVHLGFFAVFAHFIYKYLCYRRKQ